MTPAREYHRTILMRQNLVNIIWNLSWEIFVIVFARMHTPK